MKLRYSLLLAAAVAHGPHIRTIARAGQCRRRAARDFRSRMGVGAHAGSAVGVIPWRSALERSMARHDGGSHRVETGASRSVFKELASIPRQQLSPADRLNYDLFRHQYQMTVEGFQHRQHLIRTSTLDGVQGTEFIIDSLRFQTVKDFDDWVGASRCVPRLRRSEHRVDARRDEGQRPAAEGRHAAGPRTNRPTRVAARGSERIFPAVPHDPGHDRPGRSRSSHQRGPRKSPHAGAAGVRPSARFRRSRISARVLRRRRLVADQQRACGLPLLRSISHHHRSGPAGHSRARAERGRAHSRRDGSDSQAGRLQRHARGIFYAPANGSEVLLQNRRRAAGGLPFGRKTHRPRADQDQPQAAARAVWRHPDSRRHRTDVADGVRQRRSAQTARGRRTFSPTSTSRRRGRSGK